MSSLSSRLQQLSIYMSSDRPSGADQMILCAINITQAPDVGGGAQQVSGMCSALFAPIDTSLIGKQVAHRIAQRNLDHATTGRSRYA